MAGALHCIVLDDYQSVAAGVAPWHRLAGKVEVEFVAASLSPAELRLRLAEADIVVANRERSLLDASLLQSLPRLRLLVTTGMRNAAIDLSAARALGITVSGTGSAGEPTVELTWALILALSRHVVTEASHLRQGGAWQTTLGMGLHGRTIGLVGLGRVGSGVARVANAFGMNVLAWSPNLTAERAQAAGAELAPDLPQLFARADIVSLHATLSEATRGLVDASLLAAMSPRALLINTARAALVDEPALLSALTRHAIGGAALDVFPVEPLPLDHPFRRLPNVMVTPHLGYVTDDNYGRYFTDVIEDIEAWLAGTPIRLLA